MQSKAKHFFVEPNRKCFRKKISQKKTAILKSSKYLIHIHLKFKYTYLEREDFGFIFFVL